MNIFAVSPPSRAASAARLLGILLLTAAAVPAWAIPRELTVLPAAILYRGDAPAQEEVTEIIRTIESSPDVVVFPIRVAGPVVASSSGTFTQRLALEPGQGAIAVIYPDIGEPYRSVFAQIIEGIEEKAKTQVASYAVGPNVDIGELKNSLRHQDTKVVIALGRQGIKVASALDRNLGMVLGGVVTLPENEARDLPVISLSPDPSLLFSRLKGLMPGARRVFTVFDPRQNAWLIRLAKEAARNQGLELVAFEAQDLRSAVRAYQDIFAAADGRQDALWLPQDSTTVEEGSVLPMVLQESWNRNLPVFSSNFSHVRRGVLFSLYPNNVEMGRHLAGSALGFLASGDHGARGMIPLREVLMAVNLRAAKHLGLNPNRQQGYDMTFPEQ
jgi:putative ABC transport system substrate-binding protein